MLKKLLMLPLMAFALVTLTAATVEDDGEEIFEWELVDEEVSLPSKTPDSEITWSDDSDEYNTIIFDNENHLDIYFSSKSDSTLYIYYNFNDKYTTYADENSFNSDVKFHQDTEKYIHVKISNYEPEKEMSFIAGVNNNLVMEDNTPDLNTLDTFEMPLPTVFEEIGGALSTIVTAGSSVFVATFESLWDVFWDADANDGDGALNWIAYVAVLPVGFYLVRWAFRRIFNLIQQRM